MSMRSSIIRLRRPPRRWKSRLTGAKSSSCTSIPSIAALPWALPGACSTSASARTRSAAGDGLPGEIQLSAWSPQTSDYLQVRLNAEQGPRRSPGTTGIAPAGAWRLEDGKTFLQLSYSLRLRRAGAAGAADLPAHRRQEQGAASPSPGRRPTASPGTSAGRGGVVERNTMRYYLAIGSRPSSAPLADAAAGAVREAPARLVRGRRGASPRQLHEHGVRRECLEHEAQGSACASKPALRLLLISRRAGRPRHVQDAAFRHDAERSRVLARRDAGRDGIRALTFCERIRGARQAGGPAIPCR